MNASDIVDDTIIAIVLDCNEARCDYSDVVDDLGAGIGYHGNRFGYKEDDDEPELPHACSRWSIRQKLGAEVPEKVLQAKLKKMVNSGKLLGCACGCRGDFIVPRSSADVVYHYRLGYGMEVS